MTPNFDIENEFPNMIVAGCDEAGRGPLCGPVVAAAVVIARSPEGDAAIPSFIKDSKKMTAAQRIAAYDWITANTIWAIGICSPAEIDELNILQASLLAMKRAVTGLSTQPDFVLIDGNRMPEGLTGRAVVKGDSKSLSIAAASIIAKVTRDRIMSELAREYRAACVASNDAAKRAVLQKMKSEGLEWAVVREEIVRQNEKVPEQ